MIADIRLLPAAVIIWLLGGVGLIFGWAPTLGFGGCVILTSIVVAIRSVRWRPAAVLVVLLGAIATSRICTATYASSEHSLRSFADRGVVATMRVEVVERPHLLHSQGFGGSQGADRVVVPARLVWAQVAGQDIVTDGEIVILASAPSWDEVLPGQLLNVTGKLGQPRPAQLAVAVVQANGPPTEMTVAPAWQRLAATLRAGLRKACSVLSKEPAGLLPGLVDGDTSMLSPRIVDEFEVAGMSHLIGVGGINLAIVSAAVLFTLRLIRVGPKAAAIGAGLSVIGFVILAGGQPGVLRAAIMSMIGLLGYALGRERSVLSALAGSVVLLVLIDPNLALNLGFALSVLATGALVLVAPKWVTALRNRGVPPGLAEALAAPTAAHLVTAPIVAGFSGQISLVAVGANLLAEPVVAPATVLGVLATVVFPLHQEAAECLIRLAGPETQWLITVGRHAAAMPMAAVSWPIGWGGGILLTVCTVLLVLFLRFKKIRIVLAALIVGGAVVLFPTRLIAPGWPPTGWAMVGCDVGQGDAIVLTTGNPGQVVLVDTGPELTAITGCLHRLGVQRVALVVLSHLHVDHIGGLSSVLTDYHVGAIGIGPLHQPEWAWRQVRQSAETANVPIVELDAGQRFSWPELALDVIAPNRATFVSAGRADGTTINDSSAVLKAATRAGRVLLTGDVELAAQAGLLSTGSDLQADVLKVPHHGSRYSLPQFLACVHPRVAMISVGAGNSFGHPNSMVVDALTNNGVTVLRTDRDGDVAVLPGSNGPAVARRGEPRASPGQSSPGH